MRTRAGTVAAVLTVLALLVAGGVGAGFAAPSPTPGATHAAPSPTPGATHAVPPPAPTPTDHGDSPAAPDPHPPRGGVGPNGEAVGGARLLSRTLVLPKGAPKLPADLTARSWVVVDLDNGDVIAARDPHGRYQPASIQKLLTAITLLPRLAGSTKVVVSRKAADTEGSHAGLVAGGTYTVDQIFRGLLLVSGNDAAEALAEAAGGRTHTVALMNATAQQLGAYDTFVQTPSGLDGWQQLTSAYDMALFLRAALAQPRFVADDTVAKAKLPAQRAEHAGAVALYNQNVQFLHTVRGALVAKTGYTDAAQHTFAGAIERGGHRYGVVLMRAQRYPDDQWVQATKLVDWARTLPAGSPPVGHLDGSVAPAGSTPSRSATTPARRPSTSTPAPSSSSNSSPGKAASSTSGPRLLILLVLIGAAVLLTQRLRRPR